MLQKLAELDKRWIFLALAVVVILPLVFPLGLPVEPGQMSRKFYERIEALPEGSKVCMSFDYGPGTEIECQPMASAVLKHLFRRRCRVVCITLLPDGSMLARRTLEQAAAECKAVYGEDCVYLGYKNGGEAVLRNMGENILNVFSTDFYGKDLSSMPIMKDTVNWDSFALVIDWSVGRPGVADYVRIVGGQYHRPILAGTTAVTAPEAYPFVNAGQVEALLGGLRGGGEYEVLAGIKGGRACRGLEAQSTAHFFVAFLIILANVIYFADKRKKIGRGSGERRR
ncbi:hypothetical protein IJT93_11805 [bacterium]|nr:hypothetical protein [bacterium]